MTEHSEQGIDHHHHIHQRQQHSDDSLASSCGAEGDELEDISGGDFAALEIADSEARGAAAPLIRAQRGSSAIGRQAPCRAVVFSWTDVSYSVLVLSQMRVRQILRGVSGIAAPGSRALGASESLPDVADSDARAMTAVLGPSGAGALVS